MSCCGQKREAAASEQRPSPRVEYRRSAPLAPHPTQAAAPGATVTLRFRDRSPTVVVGPSGKRYQFHGQGSMQAVDRSDAESLVASGLFERVWG